MSVMSWCRGVYDDLDKTDIGSIINCRIEKPVENIDASFVQYAPAAAYRSAGKVYQTDMKKKRGKPTE